MIGGVIIWFLIAIPIGVISALRPRSLADKGLMMLVLIGASAHPIWLGLVLSYLLGYKLHIFPITGYCNFSREGDVLRRTDGNGRTTCSCPGSRSRRCSPLSMRG